MKRFSIFHKLIFSYLSVAIFAVVLISAVFYKAFKTALIERTSAQLASINVLKKIQIYNYLVDRIGHHETVNDSIIQMILLEKTGMGKTGESYIVGEDYYMRSMSRFYPNLKNIKVNTEAARAAFEGKEAVKEIVDYRGEEVLSAYSLITTKEIKLALISEIDMNEAMRPVYKVGRYIVFVGVLLIILIIIITIILSKKIANPVIRLKNVVQDLSKGVLPASEIKPTTTDEIGEMTSAINEFVGLLHKTSSFAFEIGKGNFESTYEPLSKQDELGNALIQMRDRLKVLNEKELNLVRERSAALLEGEETERKRMAREMHDGIGQMLTAIRIRLNLLENLGEERDELKKMLDDTINEIKRISKNLMPGALIDFGLPSAIKGMVDQLSTGSTKIKFEYKGSEAPHLPFDMAVSIYRIAQEGLNNSIRHSKAALINVSVEAQQDIFYMKISDNGAGFDINKSSEEMFNGIKNMQERVRILGGKFTITSTPEKGTQLTITIPFNKK